ncbi:hypothetical protein VTI74DRAFT_1944 [Chaetomium olivicolor]
MRSNTVPSLMGLILPIALASAAAQSTGLITLFVLDSEPVSLEASAIAVNTVGTDPVTTLQVACPTAASPENDACRSAGIYPAQVYHTKGSVWGGTTTYSADDSTTTWVCSLGGAGVNLSATCTKDIISGGSTRTVTTKYEHDGGDCYVAAHQRPVVVTAGVDKINKAHYISEIDAGGYVTMRSSWMAKSGCATSKMTMFVGAAAAATSEGSSPTGAMAGSGGPAGTTPPPTEAVQPSAATISTSKSGAARCAVGLLTALVLGVAATLLVL